jgi:16S rRNA (uracil1498-N3)-methyltransferase
VIRVVVEDATGAGTLELTVKESHYLTQVRRATPGDRLELRDLSGRRAAAVLESLRGGSAVVRIVERLPDAPGPAPVHLLVAVPKRSLLDGVVRASSEIGASRLTPVLAGRSVMLPGAGRLERWRRIAEESMRQCGRRVPLVVDQAVPFAQALELADPRSKRLLLHPDPEAPFLAEVLSARASGHRAGGPVTLAVGPEGGFEEDEIELARSRGFLPVRLGDNILRVETAALAATAIAVAAIVGPRLAELPPEPSGG